MLSPVEIDRICTEFEAKWTLNQSLSTIADVLSEHGTTSQSELLSELLLAEELISIDIERRWREWANSLRIRDRVTATTAIRRLRLMPTTRDYRNCLHKAGVVASKSFDEHLAEAIRRHELYCRRTFGDLPRPFCGEDIKYSVSRLHLSFELDQVQVADFTCWGDVRIGRQCEGEPQLYSMVESEPPKIICAKGRDSWVSRRQLRIRTISDSLVAMENESDGRSFMVRESRSQFVLPAKGHEIFRVPCVLVLNDLAISVNRLTSSSCDKGELRD